MLSKRSVRGLAIAVGVSVGLIAQATIADTTFSTQVKSGVTVKSLVASNLITKRSASNGFAWGENSQQADVSIARASSRSTGTSGFRWDAEAVDVADGAANYTASRTSSAQVQGFRWGLRSAADQKGFRWGLRSASEQQGFRWGLRNSSEQQGFRWGLRNSSEQQGFRWGLRNVSDQQGFRWGLR